MYQYAKRTFYGRDLLQRNVGLCSTEKENNLILLYEDREPSKPRLIARIHEIWGTEQTFYSLKIRCSNEEKKFVLKYVKESLPLADFEVVECVYFELVV